MNYNLGNQKIIGAFIVGLALVGGAYTISNLSNFGTTGNTGSIISSDESNSVYAVTAKPSTRTYVAVTDADQNGIEDWREEFVPITPIIIDATSTAVASFSLPKTLTDQVGIQLFQSTLRAKGMGNVGPTKSQIVVETADILRNTAIKDTIYDALAITVTENSPATIRAYGNAIGQILIANNVVGSEGELVIMQRALQTENPDLLTKLDPIILMYKNMRNETLATPVPRGFEKQHLDLINVYQAMYATLGGMKLAFNDPVVALLRIKRYQDDATGLGIALQNIYKILVPYANLFTKDDPVIVLLAFSPK